MIKFHHDISSKDNWLSHLAQLRSEQDVTFLKTILDLYQVQPNDLFDYAVNLADILLHLGLDTETLAASLLFPLLQDKKIKMDQIKPLFSEQNQKLLSDLMQMQSIPHLLHVSSRHHDQIEKLRKMLLAMATDMRAVMIILADKLVALRRAKTLDARIQEQIAQGTLDIYAPLANRLGVWQIKWEMEDLCLRYLNPKIYKTIATWLASKRKERETYIENQIESLNKLLKEAGITNFQVMGRVKHIYSIYQKMMRKNAPIEQIFDISALRVLVDNIDDCYTVLGILQNLWAQVPEEFDDYIAQPKPNGYRSIHTVIIDKQNRMTEVQIRTRQMHEESELGIAAHWQYKEGKSHAKKDESKIILLRQIMAWQKEVTHQPGQVMPNSLDLFADRVYVFTPVGDIVDLPKGATPLDFAYHIHSEVGHRCRGAIVDGNIVSLVYPLQTGEHVEILTSKEAKPSRDWLSPHQGYLKTSRARAKVQHWFRLKDSAQNAILGKQLLEKELKKLDPHPKINSDKLAKKFNFHSEQDLFAAIGIGDLGIASVMHQIKPKETHVESPISYKESPIALSAIEAAGIDNLLSHIAGCCKPLPQDEVIGYITRSRGVMIHRRDCSNILRLSGAQHDRLITINWREQSQKHYAVDLELIIQDRSGLLKDVTTLLSHEQVTILGLQAHKGQESEPKIYLTIEINSIDQLEKTIKLLESISNVLEVRRR